MPADFERFWRWYDAMVALYCAHAAGQGHLYLSHVARHAHVLALKSATRSAGARRRRQLRLPATRKTGKAQWRTLVPPNLYATPPHVRLSVFAMSFCMSCTTAFIWTKASPWACFAASTTPWATLSAPFAQSGVRHLDGWPRWKSCRRRTRLSALVPSSGEDYFATPSSRRAAERQDDCLHFAGGRLALTIINNLTSFLHLLPFFGGTPWRASSPLLRDVAEAERSWSGRRPKPGGGDAGVSSGGAPPNKFRRVGWRATRVVAGRNATAYAARTASAKRAGFGRSVLDACAAPRERSEELGTLACVQVSSRGQRSVRFARALQRSPCGTDGR